jgi:hypothetical protein
LGNPNQEWSLTTNNAGYVVIANQGSSKVLDVTLASTVNGARIQQYSFVNGLNQQWTFVQVP